MSITIDLIRHGATPWTEGSPSRPRFGGRMNDIDLSQGRKGGESQAKHLGIFAREHGIRPTMFCSSPARRTLRTHELSAETMGMPGVRPVILSGLQELDWGEWSGQPRSIANRRQTRQAIERQGLTFRPPSGESYMDVQVRAMQAIVFAVSRAEAGGHLWVHTHKNVIKAVVRAWFCWTVEETWTATVGVASLTRLMYDHHGMRLNLVFFNKPTYI